MDGHTMERVNRWCSPTVIPSLTIIGTKRVKVSQRSGVCLLYLQGNLQHYPSGIPQVYHIHRITACSMEVNLLGVRRFDPPSPAVIRR